jgi:hypothetical protein
MKLWNIRENIILMEMIGNEILRKTFFSSKDAEDNSLQLL